MNVEDEVSRHRAAVAAYDAAVRRLDLAQAAVDEADVRLRQIRDGLTDTAREHIIELEDAAAAQA